MTPKKLAQFETDIANLYQQGKIKFPIHLSGGNEKQLIKIFKKIKSTDWVLSTWRNHFHYLLHKKNPAKLKQMIMKTGSMPIYDKNFFTSAIVGGIAPIGVGIAMALKKKRSKRHVWVMLGDMGASVGVVTEAMRFSCGHKLPITFIVEDNGLSVYTDVQKTFGCDKCRKQNCHLIGKNIKYYKYNRLYKHHGVKLEKQAQNGLF